MSFDTIELAGFAGGGEIEVPCDRIDAELSALWRGIAARSHLAVHRACLVNLVIHAGDDESEVVAGYLASSLTDRLPARVIVVRARPDDAGEGPPRAFVAASRHPDRDDGHGSQVSGEIVLLHASGAQLDRVPAVVRATLQPELATTLWWTGPVPPPRAYVAALRDVADRVVVDTEAIADDVDASHLLPAAGTGRLADLAWPRLRPWRTAIARAFDPPETRGFLRDVDAVAIGLGAGPSGSPDASAAPLLAGWLAASLRWGPCVTSGSRCVAFDAGGGRRVQVSVEPRPSPMRGIVDVAMSAAGRTLRVRRTAAGAVEADVPAGFAPVRAAAFRETEPVEALAATLLEIHADPIAPESIRRAAEMSAASAAG